MKSISVLWHDGGHGGFYYFQLRRHRGHGGQAGVIRHIIKIPDELLAHWEKVGILDGASQKQLRALYRIANTHRATGTAMGSTKKELVDDLLRKPYSLERDRILQEAYAGGYHDFDSELATPKVQLVQDLRGAGFEDLAQRTIDGAYDEEPTAEQVEEMRQQLGPDVFDKLFGRRGRGDA
jgi:hypothetical protein